MPATHPSTNGATSANGSMQPLREKVVFATNTPQRLTLEFDPPSEPRAGRFGDQYMYFFGGNKIAWFDPPVHAQIVASGAHAGEEIEICKREVRKGNRKHATWEVILLNSDEPDFGQPHAEYDPDFAPDAQPPKAAAVPAAAAVAQSVLTLGQALILAIDALEEANRYARDKYEWDEGLALADETIVKLAITAYIQAQGGKQARP